MKESTTPFIRYIDFFEKYLKPSSVFYFSRKILLIFPQHGRINADRCSINGKILYMMQRKHMMTSELLMPASYVSVCEAERTQDVKEEPEPLLVFSKECWALWVEKWEIVKPKSKLCFFPTFSFLTVHNTTQLLFHFFFFGMVQDSESSTMCGDIPTPAIVVVFIGHHLMESKLLNPKPITDQQIGQEPN